MFGRFAKYFKAIIPLSLAAATHAYINPILSLDGGPKLQIHSPKIKLITDIGDYVEKDNDSSKAVLICQLHGDQFIDHQLIKIAEDFVVAAKGAISTDFDFLLIKGQKIPGQQLENYLIIYSNKGEKVINLEPFINHRKDRPNIKVSNRHLMRRLIEAINGQRQISLSNIAQQLSIIQNSLNYSAVVIIPDEKDQKTEEYIGQFFKNNSIKSKNCTKYIVRDAQSMQLLGLRGKAPGIYLLSAANHNLLPQFKEKVTTFKIGQRPFFVVPAQSNLRNIFSIPPLQPSLPPDQIVLSVYINRNSNTANIQKKIIQQLSKPEYRNFHKALFYSGEVNEAALTLEMNDYSKIALTAFDPVKPLPADKIKTILGNTYEWSYPIKEESEINSESIQRWIRQCTGENKMSLQTYKSMKGGQGWSVPLTGIEYKAKRDEPIDKVIYHYSRHCHGCKKFGGKYEQFARNRHKYPGVNFYRINNDKNKAEGVRNFNSTPVFVYYKKNCLTPFVYRMPIFTEDLFDAFLKITGSIALMDAGLFNKAIDSKIQADSMISQLLSEKK